MINKYISSLVIIYIIRLHYILHTIDHHKICLPACRVGYLRMLASRFSIVNETMYNYEESRRMRTLEKGHHQHFCIVVTKMDIVKLLLMLLRRGWMDDTKTTTTTTMMMTETRKGEQLYRDTKCDALPYCSTWEIVTKKSQVKMKSSH